jgi:glucan phosphoethanolaminetransferase (alkaline phosphatase superfamily)
MDELDQLKKQWKENENFTKLNQFEIKALLHRSSTSIVKWIFIISLIELSLGIILSFMLPSSEREESAFFQYLGHVSELVFYIGIGYFIYSFFKSYASISSTSNTKNLLVNIMKTRKHVENYIKFNIYFIIYSFFVAFIELTISRMAVSTQWGANFFMTIVFAVCITLVAYFFVSIFKFYYKIVYRRLLKKLNKNYEELTRLEKES